MEKIPPLQDLDQEIYSFLARRFPVCCWSDEFVFFPQAVAATSDWSCWDDLSPDSVEETALRLRTFRERLDRTRGQDPGDVSCRGKLVSLSQWAMRNLEEQFTLVKTHATQPTFALTVATVGLIQAYQSKEDGALNSRLKTLPVFLENSFKSLSGVPELYRDLGVAMAQDLTHWLGKMGCQIDTGSAEEAVREFGQRLSRMAVTEDFRLDRNLFEQVVCRHTGSTLTLTEALQELEDEACVAGKLLTEEARKFGYGGDWESCYRNIEEEPLGPDDRKGLLRLEIDRLREHCIRQGFLSGQVPTPDGIDIEFLPPSLASIRAADSYNARPGYPFQGGVFYIFKSSSLGASIGSIHPSYRMTAAHETYPGHHLLDFFRWNNPEPVLRSTEYPLFYEGWACFGEDLMFHTGAFERAYDRLILLRRRFRHALRGKVDLMVHSGKMGIEDAAGKLALGGFSGSRALDMARKYALRPAYQMCYTIGRRQFQKLFESYGQRDIPEFVNTVLSSGELLFKDLEKVLQQTMRHGDTETLRHGESID